jgi:hypothetical protein
MALFNILKEILVQAGASIPSGIGYPFVKNVIKVLYDYDPEVLNEAQDRYSALSPGVLVPAVIPFITAGNAPTLGSHAADTAIRAHGLATRWKPKQKYTHRRAASPASKKHDWHFKMQLLTTLDPQVSVFNYPIMSYATEQFYHSHFLTCSAARTNVVVVVMSTITVVC